MGDNALLLNILGEKLVCFEFQHQMFTESRTSLIFGILIYFSKDWFE